MKYGCDGQRPVVGHGRGQDQAAEVVRGGQEQPLRRGVALHPRDRGRGDQARPPRRPSWTARTRSAPPSAPPRRPGRSRPGSRPRAGCGSTYRAWSPARPACHASRIGSAVSSSCSPPVSGAALPLSSPLRGNDPLRQLQSSEHVVDDLPGGGQVAVGEEPGERLVGVPREHLPVGAEVRREAVARGLPGRDRLAPRAGQRGGGRAGERLVLAGLEHVGAQPVGGRVPRAHRSVRPGAARRQQARVVGLPARLVRGVGGGERRGRRGQRGAHRVPLGAAEPERHGLGPRRTRARRSAPRCRCWRPAPWS